MTDIGRSSQSNSVEPESAVREVTMTTEKPMKRVSKRGRKPSRIDTKAKLERSRQSARECRARKKLRYQYVEELVASREKSIQVLRDELEMYKGHCKQLDRGEMPPQIDALVQEHSRGHRSKTDECLTTPSGHL
ncbi:cAMP-responsive element-binding protein-like 2 [Lamellibrachia satsuma]|nr:cAMP-responsive element-binding protein-like 2 [Lamellibrachia satsuma]